MLRRRRKFWLATTTAAWRSGSPASWPAARWTKYSLNTAVSQWTPAPQTDFFSSATNTRRETPVPELVITLDIGGSGVKASCFDLAGDLPTTADVVPYPSAATEDDGVFDPGEWADTAVTALEQLVA